MKMPKWKSSENDRGFYWEVDVVGERKEEELTDEEKAAYYRGKIDMTKHMIWSWRRTLRKYYKCAAKEADTFNYLLKNDTDIDRLTRQAEKITEHLYPLLFWACTTFAEYMKDLRETVKKQAALSE